MAEEKPKGALGAVRRSASLAFRFGRMVLTPVRMVRTAWAALFRTNTFFAPENLAQVVKSAKEEEGIWSLVTHLRPRTFFVLNALLLAYLLSGGLAESGDDRIAQYLLKRLTRPGISLGDLRVVIPAVGFVLFLTVTWWMTAKILRSEASLGEIWAVHAYVYGSAGTFLILPAILYGLAVLGLKQTMPDLDVSGSFWLAAPFAALVLLCQAAVLIAHLRAMYHVLRMESLLRYGLVVAANFAVCSAPSIALGFAIDRIQASVE